MRVSGNGCVLFGGGCVGGVKIGWEAVGREVVQPLNLTALSRVALCAEIRTFGMRLKRVYSGIGRIACIFKIERFMYDGLRCFPKNSR